MKRFFPILLFLCPLTGLAQLFQLTDFPKSNEDLHLFEVTGNHLYFRYQTVNSAGNKDSLMRYNIQREEVELISIGGYTTSNENDIGIHNGSVYFGSSEYLIRLSDTSAMRDTVYSIDTSRAEIVTNIVATGEGVFMQGGLETFVYFSNDSTYEFPYPYGFGQYEKLALYKNYFYDWFNEITIDIWDMKTANFVYVIFKQFDKSQSAPFIFNDSLYYPVDYVPEPFEEGNCDGGRLFGISRSSLGGEGPEMVFRNFNYLKAEVGKEQVALLGEYVACDTSFLELWVSEGMNSGKVLIGWFHDVAEMKWSGDYLLFWAEQEPGEGFELWKSDGTLENTYAITDLNLTSPELIEEFVTDDFFALFSYDDGIHGKELWQVITLEEYVEMIKDINPIGSSNPTHITLFEGNAYMEMEDGTSGRQLWWYDVPQAIITSSSLLTNRAYQPLEFYLYPNPVDSENLYFLGIDEPFKVTLTDMAGRHVLTQELDDSQSFDLKGVFPGNYVVKLYSNEGVYSSMLRVR